MHHRSTTVHISHWPSDERRTGTIDFKLEVVTPARDRLFEGIELIFPAGKTDNFSAEHARRPSCELQSAVTAAVLDGVVCVQDRRHRGMPSTVFCPSPPAAGKPCPAREGALVLAIQVIIACDGALHLRPPQVCHARCLARACCAPCHR